MHRTPRGLHDLMILDDETIDWLLKHLPRNLVRPSSRL